MRRHLWMACGILSVALGAIGAFVPVMPTTIFLIIALFCFARSHPEWEQRLLDHPRHGPTLRAWRERRAIPRAGKVGALGTMALSVAATGLLAGWKWALIPLGVMATVGLWIATRPE
ncbi:YbaN family protein [Novosphingobium sp. ZN18A2]|uniref:YbaN family protein n=1 Tax=Novosphingobium sp. ZN18A2 TaxID=3079861 RepID=UPI0030D0739A